jgi:hypothetical protein
MGPVGQVGQVSLVGERLPYSTNPTDQAYQTSEKQS